MKAKRWEAQNHVAEIVCAREIRACIIQPVDETELSEIGQQAFKWIEEEKLPILYVAIGVSDWNRELSPWKAPAVLGNRDFGGEAEEFLSVIRQIFLPKIMSELAQNGDDKVPIILGGYSLAGLFALWAAYREEVFDVVMAASPSVWYPEWDAYSATHSLLARKVYLSLGDREERTKNPVLSRVGEGIRQQYEEAKEQIGEENCVLQWNAGNHFTEIWKRCTKGFSWCMEGIR